MTSETSVPKHLLTLKLSDRSARPDAELCERLVDRRPFQEDLAIQAAWQFAGRVVKLDLTDYEPPVFCA